MSKPKFQMNLKIPNLNDLTLWSSHSFDICLPARSRFGEGRDFEI
jgi:hypothetical protein